MAIKFVTTDAPARRRSLPLDPATVASIDIKSGQVVNLASTGFAVKADGDVGGPAWAFTSTSRKDVQAACALTVVDGPFVAEINTDGYDGSPTLNAHLICGTAGTVGKLVVQAVSTVAHLSASVARCIRTADADGFIMVKVTR